MNSEAPSKLPAYSSLVSRVFNPRAICRVFGALAVLAMLIGLFYIEENWRGKHAWLKYRRELEGKGEKLDFKDYIPTPVPDDQNFAMTPFLAPLFDFNPRPLKEGQSTWRDTNGYARALALSSEFSRTQPNSVRIARQSSPMQSSDLVGWALAFSPATNSDSSGAALTRPEAASTVLRALEKYRAVLDELQAASHRPRARFNIRYDEDFAPGILLPHLAVLKTAASILNLRSSAELALDQPGQAWADTSTALSISASVKDEPFLISKLVQIAVVQNSVRTIWEGLAEHRWSDAQLLEMQRRLEQIDLLADAAMRGERALDILTVEQLRVQGAIERLAGGPIDPGIPRIGPHFLIPTGWFYQNQLTVAREFQDFILPAVDAPRQRFYPLVTKLKGAILEVDCECGPSDPFKIFARLLLRALPAAQIRFAHGQTLVNEAVIACALERYRLANGQFPESLAALSPGLMRTTPNDIITGEPLKYRRAESDNFTLYSVGWNERDDDGQVVMTRGESPALDLRQGDWVWQYPKK